MKHEEFDTLLKTEFKNHVVEPSADFTSALIDLVKPVPQVRTVEANAASFTWIWPALLVGLVVAAAEVSGLRPMAPKFDWQLFSGYLSTPIGTLTIFALFLVGAFFTMEERLMSKRRRSSYR